MHSYGAAAVALLSGLAWRLARRRAGPQPPQPSPLPTPLRPAGPAADISCRRSSSPRPAGPSRSAAIAGTVQVIHQDRIAKSTAKSVTELLAENAVGFMSEWTAGPDLDQHPRRRHRGPGPRLQEPGADPDQRPSCRHRQHLQAVDRRRRAHRDRAWPVLGRLRQPEHGRRDQHHPEDRPHRDPAPSSRRPAARGTMSRARLQNGGITGTYDWYVGGDAGRAGRLSRWVAAQVELNTAWTRYGGTGAFG